MALMVMLIVMAKVMVMFVMMLMASLTIILMALIMMTMISNSYGGTDEFAMHIRGTTM